MICTIQTPTNGLSHSRSFYDTLGFRLISSERNIVYSDGKVIIEINPDRMARAGIRCYRDSWEDMLPALRGMTAVTTMEDGNHIVGDATGTWIYLINGQPAFDAATTDKSFTVLGNYAGLTLESTDIERSAALYETLGFRLTAGAPAKGFASYTSNGFSVTMMKPLMCPHLFFNPSLTYFNGGQNLPVVEKVRELGIAIAEEITLFNKEGLVDNIIIRDPGGYGFFVFND